jgi:hypothetical protein
VGHSFLSGDDARGRVSKGSGGERETKGKSLLRAEERREEPSLICLSFLLRCCSLPPECDRCFVCQSRAEKRRFLLASLRSSPSSQPPKDSHMHAGTRPMKGPEEATLTCFLNPQRPFILPFSEEGRRTSPGSRKTRRQPLQPIAAISIREEEDEKRREKDY